MSNAVEAAPTVNDDGGSQNPPAELLQSVLQRYDGMSDDRLHSVVTAAIRHLHAFAIEVGLTREEWFAGIQFLTATGQMCDEVRQEFILLSDTLGVSTLVEMITYQGAPGATENTVLGPFYVPGSRSLPFGASVVVDDDDGECVVIGGVVTDPAGRPIGDAVIDVWQTASNGFYAVQQPGTQDPHNCRGLFHSRADGTYEFRTVRPADYPIPGDGPVGKLLAACGRGLMRAGHVHVMASAPGFKTLITHVFDARSRYLQDDAVFGVRNSLIRNFDAVGDVLNGGGQPEPSDAATGLREPEQAELDEARIVFDIVLTPG